MKIEDVVLAFKIIGFVLLGTVAIVASLFLIPIITFWALSQLNLFHVEQIFLNWLAFWILFIMIRGLMEFSITVNLKKKENWS